jgi:hypothetical protein
MTSDAPRARTRIADLVAATPDSRDRYVDFLRAASIVVVMLGHWTMAVVTRRNGQWELGNVLTAINGAWLLTWVFQVMPVFFFVGGFSNMVTLDALERRGAGYAEFASSRTWRLLKPVLVLLAIWLPIATIAQFAGIPPDVDVLRQGTTVVTQPLWFIGIYLIVTALAPPMRALHRRFGVRVPIALITGAVIVDVLRFAAGVPYIGYLNFGFVWLLAHQLGFFYADGTLARAGSRLAWGVLAGIAALVLLTRFGPYPLSMVGLPGEAISNMNPPTICLMALTVWQVSALMLVRERVAHWLKRPRAWGAVIGANSMIMTMFLWHLTAMLIVVVTLLPSGFFPQPEVGTAAWWLLRPVWFAILCAVTALFVILLGRFERPGQAPRSSSSGTGPLAAVAVTFVIVGVCGFAVSGLVDLLHPNGRLLIAMPVSPMINIVALGIGGLLFQWSRGRGVTTGTS